MLEGILVVDMSRVLAGPFATMILSDLGAQVIKIENPKGGDETRGWGPPWYHGESAYYLSSNRNKKSVTVNIAKPEGQKIILDLVAQADVFVENFKVGGLKKYNLDYESVSKVNPQIIYCSITGFGQTGPYRDRPGYDFIIQGMSGLMSITGEPDGMPLKVGVAITDVIAGLYAAIAIIAALYRRDKTGCGEYIDISLLDTAISALVNVASNYLVTGEIPRRYGNAHPNIVPYETFQASDGFFNIGVGNDAQFGRLCSIIGAPHLADDPRYSTNAKRVENRQTLIPTLNKIFSTRPKSYWLELLTKEKIPCGPINNLKDVFDDEHVKSRNMVLEVEHLNDVLKLVASPLKFMNYKKNSVDPPPTLGQHTEYVLKKYLNFSDDEIKELKQTGVI